MSVDLRNYVQVNINYHNTKPLNRTRDTVVLLTLDTGIGDKLNGYYRSLAEYEKAVSDYNAAHSGATISDAAIKTHVKCYFANGGLRLHLVGGYSSGDKSEWIFAQCQALPAEEIVITSDQAEDILEGAARESASIDLVSGGLAGDSVSDLTGYKEKFFIASTANEDLTISSPGQIPNFAVKFGPAGIEMAAAAYLSQLNISRAGSIADYCYTIEDLSMFEVSGSANPALVNDNAKFVKLCNKDFNVDTTLVNNDRNVYGNTVSGADFTNYYVRIVLTQTLTDRIIATLASKIKFDRSGINRVANAVTQELNIYKSNGYLDSEAIWNEDDLYYSFNGVDYLVCPRNTPLKMGYKFTILPITSLTQEQRDAHNFPPVYVLIADSNGIRRIVVNGDAY